MPRKTLFDHLPLAERMAAQILDRLDHMGGECTKRELARRMSSHKKPMWAFAFDFLVQRRYIRLTPTGSRRQVMVTLVKVPKRLEPKPIMIKKRIKRRRPQSEWFKKNLPKFLERDGYGDGPDLDSLPGPGDNDPPPWPAPELFSPEPPAINLAEPPRWRRRHNDEDL